MCGSNSISLRSSLCYQNMTKKDTKVKKKNSVEIKNKRMVSKTGKFHIVSHLKSYKYNTLILVLLKLL